MLIFFPCYANFVQNSTELLSVISTGSYPWRFLIAATEYSTHVDNEMLLFYYISTPRGGRLCWLLWDATLICFSCSRQLQGDTLYIQIFINQQIIDLGCRKHVNLFWERERARKLVQATNHHLFFSSTGSGIIARTAYMNIVPYPISQFVFFHFQFLRYFFMDNRGCERGCTTWYGWSSIQQLLISLFFFNHWFLKNPSIPDCDPSVTGLEWGS